MKRKKLVAVVLTILLIAVSAGAWSVIRKRSRTVIVAPTGPVVTTYLTQGKSPQTRSRSRNLSLQPEASAMAGRLGGRFAADKRDKSVVIGTLIVGGERRMVQTIRKQTDDGEEIEIKIAGSGPSLTWNANQGAFSAGGRANASDRELIERLVFDSPDQFILGQLRGLSYFTVARNLRPPDAGDNYDGPLWNIVRIDDRQTDESKAPESPWRLYYVNTRSGLIERVESQISGKRIVAEFSGWTQQDGESFPTQIVWKQEGQTVMQYNLANFSHGDN